MVHSTKTKLETKKILDIGKYRLRARAGWYCVLIGESNVAIDPAIGGYGVADIYLGEFSPQIIAALSHGACTTCDVCKAKAELGERHTSFEYKMRHAVV